MCKIFPLVSNLYSTQAMSKHKVPFPKYDIMIKQLLRGERVTYESSVFDLS